MGGFFGQPHYNILTELGFNYEETVAMLAAGEAFYVSNPTKRTLFSANDAEASVYQLLKLQAKNDKLAIEYLNNVSKESKEVNGIAKIMIAVSQYEARYNKIQRSIAIMERKSFDILSNDTTSRTERDHFGNAPPPDLAGHHFNAFAQTLFDKKRPAQTLDLGTSMKALNINDSGDRLVSGGITSARNQDNFGSIGSLEQSNESSVTHAGAQRTDKSMDDSSAIWSCIGSNSVPKTKPTAHSNDLSSNSSSNHIGQSGIRNTNFINGCDTQHDDGTSIWGNPAASSVEWGSSDAPSSSASVPDVSTTSNSDTPNSSKVSSIAISPVQQQEVNQNGFDLLKRSSLRTGGSSSSTNYVSSIWNSSSSSKDSTPTKSGWNIGTKQSPQRVALPENTSAPNLSTACWSDSNNSSVKRPDSLLSNGIADDKIQVPYFCGELFQAQHQRILLSLGFSQEETVAMFKAVEAFCDSNPAKKIMFSTSEPEASVYQLLKLQEKNDKLAIEYLNNVSNESKEVNGIAKIMIALNHYEARYNKIQRGLAILERKSFENSSNDTTSRAERNHFGNTSPPDLAGHNFSAFAQNLFDTKRLAQTLDLGISMKALNVNDSGDRLVSNNITSKRNQENVGSIGSWEQSNESTTRTGTQKSDKPLDDGTAIWSCVGSNAVPKTKPTAHSNDLSSNSSSNHIGQSGIRNTNFINGCDTQHDDGTSIWGNPAASSVEWGSSGAPSSSASVPDVSTTSNSNTPNSSKVSSIAISPVQQQEVNQNGFDLLKHMPSKHGTTSSSANHVSSIWNQASSIQNSSPIKSDWSNAAKMASLRATISENNSSSNNLGTSCWSDSNNSPAITKSAEQSSSILNEDDKIQVQYFCGELFKAQHHSILLLLGFSNEETIAMLTAGESFFASNPAQRALFLSSDPRKSVYNLLKLQSKNDKLAIEYLNNVSKDSKEINAIAKIMIAMNQYEARYNKIQASLATMERDSYNETSIWNNSSNSPIATSKLSDNKWATTPLQSSSSCDANLNEASNIILSMTKKSSASAISPSSRLQDVSRNGFDLIKQTLSDSGGNSSALNLGTSSWESILN